MQDCVGPTAHSSQASQVSPQQIADKEKQYMKLQAQFAEIAQSMAAASMQALQPPKNAAEPASTNQPGCKETDSAAQPAHNSEPIPQTNL